jgi:hypothetical protein
MTTRTRVSTVRHRLSGSVHRRRTARMSAVVPVSSDIHDMHRTCTLFGLNSIKLFSILPAI